MRKQLRKRILIFSLATSFISIILVAVVLFIIIIRPSYHELEKRNLDTFNKIKCDENNNCDKRNLENSWSFNGADYILTAKEKFFIESASESNVPSDFWLNFSDPLFPKKFREPISTTTPAKEKWRLYSVNENIKGKSIEIMVGWLEDATWLLTPTPASSLTNQRLKEEVKNNIAPFLDVKNNQIILKKGEINSNVDRYQIVDADNGKVIAWSNGIPAYFPKQTIPKNIKFIDKEKKDFYLVKTNFTEDLIAVSLKRIANLWDIGWATLFIFLFIFLLSLVISSTFLKKYFVFSRKYPHSISEALKSGECQTIEFKRFVTDDDLLKTIVAFANTNGGTIFVGIDDNGHITGLPLQTLKEKDNFRNRICNLVRDRIKPPLLLDVDFKDLRGLIIAIIFVRRGNDLYSFNDVIYVRRDTADVHDPMLVKKILSEYAF